VTRLLRGHPAIEAELDAAGRLIAIRWNGRREAVEVCNRWRVEEAWWRDPIARDSEFERHIHIAAAERVDEGIDFACGCGSDSIRDAFPISDWDHTVVSKPGMVCCAGETDDVSAENFGQLDGDGAHATCRTRDDNGVACLQRDGMHRRVSSSSRNEQCPSLLPRNMGGTTNQMVSLDNNQFGVTGPIVRESDDLVADRDVPDRAPDCLDDAGKVAALSRGECRGPLLGEGTLADCGLSRVDASRLHPDEDLLRSRHRSVDLDDA